jgi:hypothetical protein
LFHFLLAQRRSRWVKGTHLAGQRLAEGGGPGERQPEYGEVRAAAAVAARA